MKNANRILALLMALVLVLGLATTVSADAETYSITIVNAKPDHVYEAYQIFAGDLANEANPDDDSETDNGNVSATLSNVVFADGVSYSGAGVVVGQDDDGNDIISKTAMDLAYALENGDLTFEELLADLTLAEPVATSGAQAEGKYVISGLEPGYYLVKDQAGTLDEKYDAYTDYIVEVVENSIVKPKSSVPSVVKEVKDINDTTGETGDWDVSADYDIGDDVPFKVTATLADNVADFKDAYKLVFTDTMGEGLTYNADLVLKADGKVVYIQNAEALAAYKAKEGNEDFENAEGITVSYTDTDTDSSLIITVADAKDFAGNGSELTLDYTAELNVNAIHYVEGNLNAVKLTFVNDPNWVPPTDPDLPDDPPTPPTGDTPVSVVIVYTYKVIVNKVDPQGNDVEDAGFTLFKKDTAGNWIAVTDEIKGEDMTTFEWNGLDDGTYKLEETTVPAGYNKAADTIFTITADHNLLGADHVLDLSADGPLELIEDEEDDNYGALTTDIVNKPGAVLPETGGIGTTMFYTIGGVLVLAAVVLLVSKKRMASAE